ncbi:serine hydrolase [Streptomyces sp. NRRL S-87]|uniref:serine hydrolase domain-containing protein n=1 Tax=Streptomyces sp. NRRL S-87 TaxID=1463920 RepID=UPI000A51E0FF|nr:serine hydrolase domain-containing protein [Streptomyces sp. NRRL S-87]
MATTGLLIAPLSAQAAYAADTPSPSTSASQNADDTGFPQLTPEVARKLDRVLRETMRTTKVPGAIVGLWAPGKGSYVKTFGFSNVPPPSGRTPGAAPAATPEPMSTDFYSRIGSLTKTFTVTALLELVDQGKISLDDPISKYYTDLPAGSKTTLADLDKITIRDLAGMRSGLYSYSFDPGFQQAFFTDPDRPFTPQELLDYAWKHPVMSPPNKEFFYSNTNLILLGLVVEKLTGRPLQDVIKDDVTDPAGMNRTSFPTDAAFPSPHPQGYTNQTLSGQVEDTTDWNPSWGWAAGAMISTLDDLHTWAKVMATGVLPNGNRLISKETQKQRLTTPPTTIPGAGYGLGIFNVQGWIGHNGSLPGYEALAMYLPEADATMVVLLNTDILVDGVHEPSTLFGQAITQVVTPNHVYFLPAGNAASASASPTTPKSPGPR